MRLDTTTTADPDVTKAAPALVPSEPPSEEDDDAAREVEDWLEFEELVQLRPHNFDEYHKYSINLSKFHGARPAYLGYSFIPEHPLGVCR